MGIKFKGNSVSETRQQRNNWTVHAAEMTCYTNMRNKNLEAERRSCFLTSKREASHLHQRLSQAGSLLDELAMLLQEGAEEQAEVLDEVLLIILPIGIGQPDVCVQR